MHHLLRIPAHRADPVKEGAEDARILFQEFPDDLGIIRRQEREPGFLLSESLPACGVEQAGKMLLEDVKRHEDIVLEEVQLQSRG